MSARARRRVRPRRRPAVQQSPIDFEHLNLARLELERGTVIYAQGDPAESVMYVERGAVQLTVVSRAGKEAVIALLEQGHFFGEGCLTGQPRRMASAKAVLPSTIVSIAKRDMLQEIRDRPSFASDVLHLLLMRTIRVEEDLIDQLFNSSEKRLARALVLLASGADSAKRAAPKVSQTVLAEMIGTTRSRVNFFMNKFRRLGLIEYNGGLKINDSLLGVIEGDTDPAGNP